MMPSAISSTVYVSFLLTKNSGGFGKGNIFTLMKIYILVMTKHSKMSFGFLNKYEKEQTGLSSFKYYSNILTAIMTDV